MTTSFGSVVAAIAAVVTRPAKAISIRRDRSHHGASSPHPSGSPGVRHTATLFRLVGASQRPLRCATYEGPTGLELRIEYEDREDVVKTQVFRWGDHRGVAEIAATWRRAFDAIGFRELARPRDLGAPRTD
jgi:hypothetical protein